MGTINPPVTQKSWGRNKTKKQGLAIDWRGKKTTNWAQKFAWKLCGLYESNSGNIDKEIVLEAVKQHYNGYNDKEFACSSSDSGTDDNEYTLYDDDNRAIYNELCKLKEEIEDLKTT